MHAGGSRDGGELERRDLEERVLVQRAKHGDADAYEELVARYQALVLRAAVVITGSPPDAEEAAQDAFVKAYRALGRFRDGAPFRPWLLRIVANEAINRRNSAARRRTVDLAEVFDRAADDAATSPEHAALAAERRRTVAEALARLREDDRLVITYRYLLDLPEAETADALGIARGTVKSRLFRALGRLREVLA